MSRNLKNDEDFVLIPSYKATEEEKDEQDKVMRRGGKVFRQYHERIKASVKNRMTKSLCPKCGTAGNVKNGKLCTAKVGEVVCGQKLSSGRYSRATFGKELNSAVKVNPKQIIVRGIQISPTDYSIIRKVTEIEWTVLTTYSNLIYQEAKKWSLIDKSINFEDYYNEIVAITINAMYGFSKEDIKFITYLTKSIHRKMLHVSNENKPMSAWTQSDKKIYGQFETFCRKNGVEIGFDEIVKLMGLSKKEVNDLRCMLTKVINQIEFSKDGVAEDPVSYATVGIYSAAQPEVKPVLDFDQMEAVRLTPMTDWERTVLEAYLEGNRGWMTEIAQNNINPETGQPYSRRAPRIALDRVLEKIKANCLGNVLSEAA